MMIPVSPYPWMDERTQFMTKHGSHAYGMATPQSDVDIRGFYIPPKNYFFGFGSKMEQWQQISKEHNTDIVLFDIRKFFKLASACNPNAMEILFTDPSSHIKLTKTGEEVLKHRDMFISKKAKHTFSGYAISQLRRLHNEFKGTGNYNAKDAMHLVRLMRMCKEIGETGKVNVFRADKEELMTIRHGAWKFEEVIKYAESIDTELDSVYAKSSLPYETDYDKLEELLVSIVEKHV